MAVSAMSAAIASVIVLDELRKPNPSIIWRVRVCASGRSDTSTVRPRRMMLCAFFDAAGLKGEWLALRMRVCSCAMLSARKAASASHMRTRSSIGRDREHVSELRGDVCSRKGDDGRCL